MPRICYENLKIGASILRVIEQANEIINEYAEMGFELTLRQLYYQFVARGLMANQQKNYKRLGDYISKGRRAGLVDWEAIVDRTRHLRSQPSWSSPESIIGACAQQYRIDPWAEQPYRVEVWIEKDALVGVLESACKARRIPYSSCRGFGSDSELWAAGQRIKVYRDEGKTPVILHLGDHDPSGIDMTRDIQRRLELYSDGDVDVRRLALTMGQVEEYQPPPNPAKDTDPRFRSYQDIYGDESWELDALDPRTIADLIEEEVAPLIVKKRWKVSLATEERERGELDTISSYYEAAATAAAQAKDEDTSDDEE